MRKKYLWSLVGASVLLLAGWLIGAQRDAQTDSSNAARSTATATTQDAASPDMSSDGPPQVAEERLEDARPAWMDGASAAANASALPSQAPASGSLSRAEEARSARMQAAMDRLQKLQTQKDVDPAEVETALGEVERAHGSSVLQGVRLDVLRENLRLAARMQKVAEEVQVLQQRSASGEVKGETQAILSKKLAEIEAMQRELRLDFYEGAPTAPARR